MGHYCTSGEVMSLKIYNTFSRKKEPFEPLNPPEVGMYVCGITAYDLCHIGHARCYTAFDAIYRYLVFKGFKVKYVRNFTDLDDKIIQRANEKGVDIKTLADQNIEAFYEDMDTLGLVRPDVEPRVTQHMQDIIEVVQRIIDNGYGYVKNGNVYFNVQAYDGYLQLSGRKLNDMVAGARVEVNEEKEHPLDFALWKAAKPGEPSWDSPWGNGRPGWHIECTVMSTKYLGHRFDIHGGGADLIFPHHENERAQAYAAFGTDFVKYWMHNGFVTVSEEKMSKSLHNFLTIKDVTAMYFPEALKYLLLTMGYRKPINYSEEAMARAEDRIEYFYESIAAAREYIDRRGGTVDPKVVQQSMDRLVDYMDDDFNTAGVLGGLNTDVKALNEALSIKGKAPAKADRIASLLQAIERQGAVLGLFESDPQSVLDGIRKRRIAALGITEDEIEQAIEARKAARKARDFERADAIRNELAAKGIVMMDTPQGTIWKVRRLGVNDE